MHAYTFSDGDSWVQDEVLDPNANAVSGSVTAISKEANSMLVAWISMDEALEVARYENGNWVKTQVLAPGNMAKNTKIDALSCSPTMMNLFFVGTDLLVYQSYWKQGMPNDKWVTTLLSKFPAALGGISATSMNRDHMEVFWTSPAGALYHAYWTLAQGHWISETVPGSVGLNRCQGGSHITTVARKGKSSMEGWCRSVEGKLAHFYYYAN